MLGRDSAATYAYDLYEVSAGDFDEEEPVKYPYVEGAWHKPFLRQLMTACGIPYHSQFTRLESESLRLRPLCRNCFTIFELAQAERLHEEDEKDTR